MSDNMVPARCNTNVAQSSGHGTQPTRTSATTHVPIPIACGTQEPNLPCPNSRADLRSAIAYDLCKKLKSLDRAMQKAKVASDLLVPKYDGPIELICH